MKKILFVVLVAVLAAACGKDKFQTTPQIEIKSFGPDSVSIGDFFRFTADITDKEGDLQDSFKVVQKRFRNNIRIGDIDTLRFTFKSLNVPRKTRFELEMTFSYGVIVEGVQVYRTQEAQNTEVTYGLIVSDNAGNKSDYVETRRIVLKKRP